MNRFLVLTCFWLTAGAAFAATPPAKEHPLAALLHTLPGTIDRKASERELHDFLSANKELPSGIKLVEDGGHSGTGGSISIDRGSPFVNRAKIILQQLQELKSMGVQVRNRVDIEKLEMAIKTTRVISSPGPLYNKFGQSVDAINLPNSKLIIIKESAWDKALSSTDPEMIKAAAETVLHEYYGILSKGNPKSPYYEGADMDRTSSLIFHIPEYTFPCSGADRLLAFMEEHGRHLEAYIEKVKTRRAWLKAHGYCDDSKSNSPKNGSANDDPEHKESSENSAI